MIVYKKLKNGELVNKDEMRNESNAIIVTNKHTFYVFGDIDRIENIVYCTYVLKYSEINGICNNELFEKISIPIFQVEYIL